MNGKRRHPSPSVERDIILSQRGRCGYCNSSLTHQQIEWDHFIPFSYLGRNPRDNWVAACRTCNQSKSNRVWTDEEAVYDFCYEMTRDHGELAEGWPDGSDKVWPWILESVA